MFFAYPAGLGSCHVPLRPLEKKDVPSIQLQSPISLWIFAKISSSWREQKEKIALQEVGPDHKLAGIARPPHRAENMNTGNNAKLIHLTFVFWTQIYGQPYKTVFIKGRKHNLCPKAQWAITIIKAISGLLTPCSAPAQCYSSHLRGTYQCFCYDDWTWITFA